MLIGHAVVFKLVSEQSSTLRRSCHDLMELVLRIQGRIDYGYDIPWSDLAHLVVDKHMQ